MEINWTHPELRPGETFFINMTGEQFQAFPLSSKRMGEVAYDGEGNRLNFPNWRPVFVPMIQLQRSGLDLRSLRRSWRAARDARIRR